MLVNILCFRCHPDVVSLQVPGTFTEDPIGRSEENDSGIYWLIFTSIDGLMIDVALALALAHIAKLVVQW